MVWIESQVFMQTVDVVSAIILCHQMRSTGSRPQVAPGGQSCWPAQGVTGDAEVSRHLSESHPAHRNLLRCGHVLTGQVPDTKDLPLRPGSRRGAAEDRTQGHVSNWGSQPGASPRPRPLGSALQSSLTSAQCCSSTRGHCPGRTSGARAETTQHQGGPGWGGEAGEPRA